MVCEKRLIDANALKDSFCAACSTIKRYKRTVEDCRNNQDSYGNKCFKMRLIDSVSTVEVVHGYWEDVALRYTQTKEKCSVCGGIVYAHGYNYCPNCGAKMDGD